jgi:hypothetical protein
VGTTTNNNQFECINDLIDPANGDDNEFVDEVFVLDEVFGPITLIPDIP